MQNVKVVLVGDSGIGKTCMLITYTSNSFPAEYIPTVFDNYSTNVMVDQKILSLNLFDTASGRDDGYERLRPLTYPQTDVFIAAFSVVNRTSFDNISARWIPELNHHCPTTPIIVAGTKIDLRDDQQTIEALANKNQKLISTEQGEELVQNWRASHAVAYMECSSRTSVGLKELFEEAVRTITTPGHGKKVKAKKNNQNCLLM